MNTLPAAMPQIISSIIEKITMLLLIIKYDLLLDPQAVTLSENIAKKILAIQGNAINPNNSVISPGYSPSLSLKTK